MSENDNNRFHRIFKVITQCMEFDFCSQFLWMSIAFSRIISMISRCSSLLNTHRTSNVCKTSGSCRYDKAVRSFCPIKMVGLRSSGKSCSVRISMTRSSPASVLIRNCLSPSWKSSISWAPSHTVFAFGIHIRAP